VKVLGGDILYGAFYNCSNIEEIIIGENVTSIGSSAFYNCSSLTYNEYDNGYYLGNETNQYMVLVKAKSTDITSCEINENTEIICYSAFSGCNNITSIMVPEEVKNIGSSAFEGCSSLENITIPFVGATLDGTSNTHFGYIFGAISYSYNSSSIPSTLKEVVITGGTCIGWRAFYGCTSLTSIETPSSVTSIGDDAFYGCTSLTSIEIPSSVTSIGDDAFYGCSSLIYNEYDNAYYLGNEINPYIVLVKAKSTDITSCEINENTKIIYYYAFRGCSSLGSIVIPSGVTSIGTSAFKGCSNLISITIPSGVISIGEDSFVLCDKLEKVYYDGTIEDWCKIEFENRCSNPMSYGDSFYMLDLNGSVSLNGNEYSLATEINIPEGITIIGHNQFYGFNNITSIVVSSSVTSIGYEAFYNCVDLSSITFAEESQLTSIGSSAFEGCSNLISITIPARVTSIGSSAFEGCSSLESMTIPFVGAKAGVTSSDTYQYPFGYIFGENSYTGGVATQQSYYGLKTSSTTTTTYYIPSTLKSVTVLGGNILYGAFDECSNIEEINLGEDVTSIGSYAFYNCSSLTSINIIGGVKSNGEYIFYNCSSLTSIKIASGVTSLGYSTFSGCSSLISIEIPSSVTSIEAYVFRGCSSLVSIVIPSGVKSIGGAAFYGCSSLTSIKIPSSVTSIGEDAFRYCYRLVEIYNLSSLDITIGSTDNGYIGYYAKVIHTSLSSKSNIIRKDGYIFVNDSTIYYLVGYEGTDTELVLPDSINGKRYIINDYAFFGYSSLISVVIPSSVTSIGYSAFYKCSIRSITIPFVGSTLNGSENTHFGYIFGADTANNQPSFIYLIEEVIITGGSSIDSLAFYGCRLTSITIPSSVTSIAKAAFYDCGMKKVYYKGTSFEWSNISIDSEDNLCLTNATIYYYSESEPTSSGNYWYYDSEGNIVIW
ncbi:MAG: leucine-rich repeat domain-containing protein, partial [Anaeroplasmataceae bacterium]